MASSSKNWALITRAKKPTTSCSTSSGPNTGSAKAPCRATQSPASSKRRAKRRRPRRQLRIPGPMQSFLEYVVKGLVAHPDAVTITPVEREGTTVYELRLDPQDVRSEEHTSELQSR